MLYPLIGRNLPIRGRTLSFALKLKNKKSGTNHTQTAKNAATSINDGLSIAGVIARSRVRTPVPDDRNRLDELL